MVELKAKVFLEDKTIGELTIDVDFYKKAYRPTSYICKGSINISNFPKTTKKIFFWGSLKGKVLGFSIFFSIFRPLTLQMCLVAVVGAEDEESNIKRKTLIYIYQFIPAVSNICFTRERKVLSFRIISCAALALRSRSCTFAESRAQRICSIISSSL